MGEANKVMWWLDWRHWVIGVEASDQEIAIRLLPVTISILRKAKS